MMTTSSVLDRDGFIKTVQAEDQRDIEKFVRDNLDAIRGQLLRHGAVLFRGFRVDDEKAFDAFLSQISSKRMEYVYGSSPRTHLYNSIYTSTEYPKTQVIPLHAECSYHTNWPKKIAFCCLQPADVGGATPLADLRKVTQRLGNDVVDEFERRGVKYIRHYHPYIDVQWQDVFRTTSKAEVASICKRYGIEHEWLEGDILKTSHVCQGVAIHPETRERVVFNQAHLFHVSSLNAADAADLISVFGEERLPRNSYFGDGSPLPKDLLALVRRCYDESSEEFEWQRGDVLLVDNMRFAHGRTAFEGDRRVLAGMLDPISESPDYV